MRVKLLSLLIGLSVATANAVDVIGPVYPIKEPSLLDSILSKLKQMEQTGQIQQIQQQWQNMARDRVLNPQGTSLPKVNANSQRFYDPSITVNRDIYLPDGQLLHKAGTVVNPLTIKSFSKRMIFIDATVQSQVNWAKNQYEQSGWRDKVILVKGSYVDVMKAWKHPVYFDQLGGTLGQRETLVQRFGIQAVPSMVYQSGDKLIIEEVKL